jgi:hypothetical protein
MESERERTSFQLLSTDSEEIRSLFRAMGLLHAAIADINEMVGTAASQEVAFVAIRRLEGDIRNQISLEWSGRHFRASESLTRTLDIIVCAESNLGR